MHIGLAATSPTPGPAPRPRRVACTPTPRFAGATASSTGSRTTGPSARSASSRPTNYSCSNRGRAPASSLASRAGVAAGPACAGFRITSTASWRRATAAGRPSTPSPGVAPRRWVALVAQLPGLALGARWREGHLRRAITAYRIRGHQQLTMTAPTKKPPARARWLFSSTWKQDDQRRSFAATSSGRSFDANLSSTPLTYLCPSIPPNDLVSSTASLITTRYGISGWFFSS